MANKTMTAEDISKRLKRIEGQVRGIQRMLQDEAGCMDVLVQVSAVRAAVSKVGIMVFERHVQKCLAEAMENKENNSEQMLADVSNLMNKFIK